MHATRDMLVYLLLGIALFKCGILVLVGPSSWPDTGIYVAFADAILDHGMAFAPVAWGAEAVPPFIFRLAGYPLILAAAKLLSPVHWESLVVGFQGVLNGVAIWLMFKVAERVFRSAAAALAVTILYAFSGSILWDNSLLADSIYASLFNIVVFALLGQLVGCWRLSHLGNAGLAALWGYSILMRDSGLYFTFLPVILLLADTASNGRVMQHRLDRVVVFLLIVGSIVCAYVLLNWYRTGEAFFSITGVENWLRPIFDMVRYGYAQPFTGDDLVSQTVRETMTEYDFPAQLQFIAALHVRCHCTPTQIQSLVFGKYLSSVWHHPVAYARVVVANFNYLGLSSNLADPMATINQFVQFGTPIGRRIIPGLSIRQLLLLKEHFSATRLMLMILSTISTTLCALLFTLFLFGIPFHGLRVRRGCETMTEPLATASFLWFVFMSVSLAFSMVHYEARHALPVLPAAQLGIVYMLSRLKEYGSARAVTMN
jgi:hypothetical protein